MDIGNWDGTIDCGWDDLSEWVKKTISEFSKTILKYPQCAPSDKVGELITEKSVLRFSKIADVLAEEIKQGYDYQYEDLFDDVPNGKLINCWVLLGALIEVALQMFLTIYIMDYKNMAWQQWKDFKSQEVRESLFSTLRVLVQNGNLTSKQSESIKNAIEEKIYEHTVEHPVERVMLDELIQICEQEELFNREVNSYMRLIQKSRNAIHAYIDRTIGTWNELQYATRFLVAFVNELVFRLPELPDEEFE